MDKFLNSQEVEVYEEIVDNAPQDEDWLLGLVAFAVIEEQKVEWIKDQTEAKGRQLSLQEIDAWYQQQPPGVKLRAKDTAKTRLENYAESAIGVYAAKFDAEVEEGVVVEEIQKLGWFWRQVGIGTLGSFVGTVIFALISVLFVVLVYNDVSLVSVVKELMSSN